MAEEEQTAQSVANAKEKRAYLVENRYTGGLVMDRSVTDPICCIIFMLTLAAMIGAGIYGYSNGSVYKLVVPFDTAGVRCQGEYPLSYYYNLHDFIKGVNDLSVYNSVCVSECPKQGATLKCAPANSDECNDIAPYQDTNNLTIPTYCLPDLAKSSAKQLDEFVRAMAESEGTGAYLADLMESYAPILYMSVVAVFVTVLYLYILQWVTMCLLYFSIFLVFAGLVATGAWSAWMSTQYPDGSEWQLYARVGAGLSIVIALLYMICVCCCWTNITLGASVMKVGAEFVTKTLHIVGLPFLSTTFTFLFIGWWLACAAWIYTVGDVKFIPNSFFTAIDNNSQIHYLMWFFLFCLFWTLSFIGAYQVFAVAATAAQYYFSGAAAPEDMQGDAKEFDYSVCRSMGWGATYHIGSLAFGSFILAVATLFRVIVERMASQAEDSENPAGQCIACCVVCCARCLEDCIEALTENAYIQVALSSQGFCTSGYNALYLQLRQAGRFTAANMVDWMLSTLGKGAIMGTSAFLTYLVVKYNYPRVFNPWVPTMVVALVAYIIASVFLSLFSTSALTILHSFCLDEESGKSKWTPTGLVDFIDATATEAAARNQVEEGQQPKPQPKKDDDGNRQPAGME